MLEELAFGRDGQIRTAGLPLRRRLLYPSELRPLEGSETEPRPFGSGWANFLQLLMLPLRTLPAPQPLLPDVLAEMHSPKADLFYSGIGILDRRRQGLAARRYAKHAAAVRQKLLTL